MKQCLLYFISIGAMFILLSATCRKNSENCHVDLFLKNNSNISICNQMAFLYPDTLINERDIFLGYNYTESLKIIPNENYKLNWGYRSCFECLYDKNCSKERAVDTLSVFLFSYDTLKKYPWQTIREGYKILKRYDLSLEDLKKLNWKIAYPPTPEMRYMKQFPAYGE